MRSELVLVNPFKCRPWHLHDRLESNITDETCRAEIESFSRQGQIVPALGRALRGDSDYDVEIICGARRLFVARHIKRDLLVELREVSDREALILMDLENRQRVDISPYERGMSYARWMRSGHFESQEDIAKALKISPAQVSRLLKIARLPAVVVNAFTTPCDICESWGLELIAAIDDPQRRAQTIARARRLSLMNPRPKSADVYAQMLTVVGERRRPKTSSRDTVVKDDRGHPLFRIRQLRRNTAFLLAREHAPPVVLEAIQGALTKILTDAVRPMHSRNASPQATERELRPD